MTSDNTYSSSVSQNWDLHATVPSRPRRGQPGSPSSISVFKNAKNIHLNNSSVTINNLQVPGDPLNKLYERVATNAILNTGGRADEVKCYPGTREELISLIDGWMDGSKGTTPNMMWLSGPAGAGKSAIVQTVTERCKERGVQAASFFFFRADPTRSSARPLVATLLYQIFKFYPPARQTIAAILSDDPLLFDASCQDQFKQLLLTSLHGIPKPLESPARRPIVLLVDGLDECDSERKSSQKQILHALDRLLTQNNSPFLALVASRAEAHIAMAFKQLVSPIQSIFLDDQYRPEEDIRMFVVGEFNEIKRSHHFAHTLSEDWPADADIRSIVRKSSGQFIYAATVMRYIANSSASPKLSLERVQGIAPVASNSPFAHLDAIYTYIFSQAEDRKAVMDLLATQLLISSMGSVLENHYLHLKTILSAYNARYTSEALDSCVVDLAAILKFYGGNLHFFHASLPDFLQDESRAGVFYIDVDAFGAKILPSIWMKASELMGFGLFGITIFVKLKMPTPDITHAFRTISPMSARLPLSTRLMALIASIFHSIHRLYYSHDNKSYRKILRQWIIWFMTSKPRDSTQTSGMVMQVDLPHLPSFKPSSKEVQYASSKYE